jgi:predicted amidophosphoribosyltransferase
VSDPVAALRPDRFLIAVGGGYLRNPVRIPRVTCADCAAPVEGYDRCFMCSRFRSQAGLADATAFLTYAIHGQESGHLMRGYKAVRPVDKHRLVVGLLLRSALERHTACIARLSSSPVSHWSTVPSLPAKPRLHALRGLVTGRAPGTEVALRASTSAEQPRALNAGHFTCAMPLNENSHVLLIDDTWTTGGHAQSAVLALRRAGAVRVSVLVVARWLREDYKDNKQFIADLRTRDYDPTICPWTGGRCPEKELP